MVYNKRNPGYRKAYILQNTQKFLLNSYTGYVPVVDLQNLNLIHSFRYTDLSSHHKPTISEDGNYFIALHEAVS